MSCRKRTVIAFWMWSRGSVKTALAVIVVAALAGPLATPAAAQATLPTSGVSEDARGVGQLLGDSLKLLMIEHGTRIAFQEKTRRELGGPFWSDYMQSVRVPGQWNDTDSWAVNYVGHPIHGAAAGYLWLDHERDAPKDLTLSKSYWSSRGRAMAWSAVYSLQFEIGPLSEASIGNVGMDPATTGWVDHVVTPVGAFGWIVVEDALDRYVVRRFEDHTQNKVARAAMRLLCNPGRGLSNAASGRAPWYRDGRPLTWR